MAKKREIYVNLVNGLNLKIRYQANIGKNTKDSKSIKSKKKKKLIILKEFLGDSVILWKSSGIEKGLIYSKNII
mgnify:CR=1 FL=1